MPPKRDVAELRALADDPLNWLQTPVASRADVGLAADYLSAFLKHHQMPVTRRQVDGFHGPRLWQSKESCVPEEHRDASTVRPGGILALVRAFDHGFAAPRMVQDKFLEFLRAFPGAVYAGVADALQDQYQLCRAFRVSESALGSPPSFLDLYKDERVSKKWRNSLPPSVLINANELLRTWPGLMAPTWNPNNAPRDALAWWENCHVDADKLREAVDQESPDLGINTLVFYALSFGFIIELQWQCMKYASTVSCVHLLSEVAFLRKRRRE